MTSAFPDIVFFLTQLFLFFLFVVPIIVGFAWIRPDADRSGHHLSGQSQQVARSSHECQRCHR